METSKFKQEKADYLMRKLDELEKEVMRKQAEEAELIEEYDRTKNSFLAVELDILGAEIEILESRISLLKLWLKSLGIGSKGGENE